MGHSETEELMLLGLAFDYLSGYLVKIFEKLDMSERRSL